MGAERGKIKRKGRRIEGEGGRTRARSEVA